MAMCFVYEAEQVYTSRNEHIDRIGSGSFGSVRRVWNKKIGLSAIKMFRITGTLERQRTIRNE